MPNPRVVVADDHDETRARIVSLLASEFDVVATVADGQAAVEACGALHPDWSSSTSRCPCLNGFQAADIIRDLPDRAQDRLRHALTTMRNSLRAACEIGASALVPKRRMVADLVPAVRRALHFHAVCFYDDAPSLSRTVAGFIGEGLTAGEAAVVIATSSHGAAIREQLTAIGVDSAEADCARRAPDPRCTEVLNSFMVGGLPDAGRFRRHDDADHGQGGGEQEAPGPGVR